MVRSSTGMLGLLRLGGERMRTSSEDVDEETDSNGLFPVGLAAARFRLRLWRNFSTSSISDVNLWNNFTILLWYSLFFSMQQFLSMGFQSDTETLNFINGPVWSRSFLNSRKCPMLLKRWVKWVFEERRKFCTSEWMGITAFGILQVKDGSAADFHLDTQLSAMRTKAVDASGDFAISSWMLVFNNVRWKGWLSSAITSKEQISSAKLFQERASSINNKQLTILS